MTLHTWRSIGIAQCECWDIANKTFYPFDKLSATKVWGINHCILYLTVRAWMALPTGWTVMSAKATNSPHNSSAHLEPTSSVNIWKCPLHAKKRLPVWVSVHVKTFPLWLLVQPKLSGRSHYSLWCDSAFFHCSFSGVKSVKIDSKNYMRQVGSFKFIHQLVSSINKTHLPPHHIPLDLWM